MRNIRCWGPSTENWEGCRRQTMIVVSLVTTDWGAWSCLPAQTPFAPREIWTKLREIVKSIEFAKMGTMKNFHVWQDFTGTEWVNLFVKNQQPSSFSCCYRYNWHFGQNLPHQKDESTGWSLFKQPVGDKSTGWSLSKLPVEVRFVTSWGAVCDRSVQCKMWPVGGSDLSQTGPILHCMDRS